MSVDVCSFFFFLWKKKTDIEVTGDCSRPSTNTSWQHDVYVQIGGRAWSGAWSGSTLTSHHQFLMLQFFLYRQTDKHGELLCKSSNYLWSDRCWKYFPTRTRRLSEETSGEYVKKSWLASSIHSSNLAEGMDSHFTFLLAWGKKVFKSISSHSSGPCISRLDHQWRHI